MTRVVLNIEDYKVNDLIAYLKSLSYVTIEENSSEVSISDTEKTLMRNRLKLSKESDFEDWNHLKKELEIL